MLNRFGRYILDNPLPAAFIAFGFRLLPLFGWVSFIILALVTLRNGAKIGASILLALLLADGLHALVIGPQAIFVGFIGGSLFLWLMALVLRVSASWTTVLEATMIFAAVVVLLAHLFLGDLNQWWVDYYQQSLAHMDAQIKSGAKVLGAEQLQQWRTFKAMVAETDFIQFIAKVITGTLTIMVLILTLVNLVIARWWQASLFNPGGLREELVNVRLGYVASGAFLLLGLLALLDLNIAWDFLPIAMGVFLVAGLSLVHFVIGKLQWAVLILIMIYTTIIAGAPYSLAALVTIGVADSILNLRQRRLMPKTK